jgi:hypothetical protein
MGNKYFPENSSYLWIPMTLPTKMKQFVLSHNNNNLGNDLVFNKPDALQWMLFCLPEFWWNSLNSSLPCSPVLCKSMYSCCGYIHGQIKAYRLTCNHLWRGKLFNRRTGKAELRVLSLLRRTIQIILDCIPDWYTSIELCLLFSLQRTCSSGQLNYLNIH